MLLFHIDVEFVLLHVPVQHTYMGSAYVMTLCLRNNIETERLFSVLKNVKCLCVAV